MSSIGARCTLEVRRAPPFTTARPRGEGLDSFAMRAPLTMLALTLCLGCGTTREEVREAREEVILPADGVEIERDLASGVPPEFVPALEAIRLSLADGDEPTARRTLGFLLGRRPEGRTLELARGFERILDGRERTGWLDLRLEAVERPAEPAVYDLRLILAQHGPESLLLRAGGARLRVTQYAVDPDGRERRGTRRDAVPFPAELTIEAEGEARLDVAVLSLEPPTGILAFSSQFDLELLPGEFLANGRYLPVQSIPIASLEIVRLAGELPAAAIDPDELIAYVERGRIFVPALLERAVRIAPERRAEALDGLLPIVERLNIVELELLVPALRWLSRAAHPGGDPETWRRWLRARSRHESTEEEPNWERLGLPEPE